MSTPFVDLTATLRLPRAPDEESARDLARAARAGGFSVVVVSARGHEAVDVDSLAGLQRALESAGETGVHLVPALAPLRRDGADGLADMASMARALPEGTPRVLRLRAPVDDALLLRRIGDFARAVSAVVVVPSFDAALSRGAVAVEGPVATRLGLPALPEASEQIAISRIIEVAALTRARFHVAGVFTAGGAALLEQRGAAPSEPGVTGSVFASHLLFDDRTLITHRYDTRLLLRPPLPTPSSRQALLHAVKQGTLCVSSGHHFVPKRERDLEMTRATPGMATLGSLASALESLLSATELAAALSTAPARILGVDPHARPLPPPVDGAPPRDDLYRLRHELLSGVPQ